MRFELVSVGVWSLLVAGCAAGTVEEPVTQSEEEIVRGKEEKKLPQVVAVQINGYSGASLCTGTYVAPRVVVSAAHCTRFDAIPGQTFVYFGKDYHGDRLSLPEIPAPGEPSVWARAETTLVHPDYDAELHYPDLAIFYLDRELPFEPIPLQRERLSKSDKKATIAGWGGSKALVADISEVEGSGIKRSATVSILGTPTEADFHPDDPNPGILVPEIREDLVKTNGLAPSANTCAGDSGGPLLVKDHGCEKLAGVGFWTGLWCEDYAMFSRIDPFLDFFDASFERAGHAPIVPRLECVEDLVDGSLRAHFGYTSENGLTTSVPYGARNRFPKDVEKARPTAFAWGDNKYDFSVDFSAGETLTWKLSPPGGPITVVTANASAPRCDTDSTEFLCAAQCDAAFAAECSYQVLSRAQCLSDCEIQAQFFDEFGCGAEWTDVLGCLATVPPDAENWDCTFQGSPPFPLPPNCDPEWLAAFECLGI